MGNSTVPIFAETLKQAGVYDKRKVMGVTTLDVVRARAFVAENQGMDVDKLAVNVIGGHAGTTILPLLSQIEGAKFSDEDLKALTHRIQFGGDEVVQAKDALGRQRCPWPTLPCSSLIGFWWPSTGKAVWWRTATWSLPFCRTLPTSLPHARWAPTVWRKCT